MPALSTLPYRTGPRPQTTTQIPHKQLDQQPDDTRLVDDILGVARRWPHVSAQTSGISVEGACALALDDSVVGGPAEAFIVGREFCHVHAQGDRSLHATLPMELATAVESTGWGEPHFLVHRGDLPATVVMLYAPRTDNERDVVLELVRASYEFALAASTQPVS
jgi:Family of unknown function (DUF5519)